MAPGSQAVLGLVIIVAAIALAPWTSRTSDVPNDPDIGAGILLIAGLATVVGGLLRRRRRGRR